VFIVGTSIPKNGADMKSLAPPHVDAFPTATGSAFLLQKRIDPDLNYRFPLSIDFFLFRTLQAALFALF
jgi:hypothetical protein